MENRQRGKVHNPVVPVPDVSQGGEESREFGRPTVIMAVLRYVVLALPLAFLGRELAGPWGATTFQGLMMGLLVATLIGSLVYLIWVEKFLKEIKEKH